MTDQVYVDPDAIPKTATAVDQAQADLNTELTNLTTRLQELQWDGSSGDAVRRLMSQWFQGANKITQALTDFETNLTGSNTTYIGEDDAQAAIMNNIAGRLA
ncbi:MAG TPA: hypothetical protein DHV14_09765 [Micrococcales bacterium]|uniref:ESAT-6-like protein n=1 Tax=Miniimonas arenae TaxID=676201 RepID=A0A5C5BF22_9MICO|nr:MULTISPECIES: WXG100 family type VII secretion target [Miniimonas]TNU76285.1 WXG100 family type VII secretion target [Miniimonas arenae]HCX85399.1 hypothetical protein [Micrococcales bacterium]